MNLLIDNRNSENGEIAQRDKIVLTLSRRTPISYRNQSINFQSKSMDWFLYDIDLSREIFKLSELFDP